jgi:uncharacterized protein (DUF1800 family)
MERRQFLMPHRRFGKDTGNSQNQLSEDQPVALDRFLALENARTAAPPNSGLNPYTGPWTKNEVVHLLRRTLFGVTAQDVDYFQSLTINQAVTQLLNAPYTPPDPPVNDYNNANFTDPDIPSGQVWINAALSGVAEPYRLESLRAWWFRLTLRNDRSIREKMTLFWHNQMPIQFENVVSGEHNFRYLDVLRTNALGNFKTLIKNVTLNPSMLYYLNGYLNSAAAPDENYAREIQELFVIGKDLTPHYTEDDVKAAARLLTGWRISLTEYANASFNPAEHDTGDKQFSSFYNNTLIQGQSGASGGEAELDAFLSMLLAHPEAAKFICRKIYRFFVYHYIDPQTEQYVIEPLADVFRNNNYNILPVLDVLFKSEHFFDQLNRGAIIKSPMDHVVGFMRQTGCTLPANPDYTDAYVVINILTNYMTVLQQWIGDPPNVAGWQAYYEKPVLDKIWINSSTLPKRGYLTNYMVYLGLTGPNNTKIISDMVGFAASLSNPSDPNALIKDTVDLFFGLPVSQTVQTSLKAILLSSLPSDYYWTLAWTYYVANPNDMVAKGEVENRLKLLLNTMMQMEEYQLM